MLKHTELILLPNDVAREQIKAIFLASLNKLFIEDFDLIEIGAHEQSICHRLAIYLEEHIDLKVDCEYNRSLENPKRICERLIRPDILIHKRFTNELNLLVVEAKANSNNDTSDADKLLTFVAPDSFFNYRLGVFLRIHNSHDEIASSMGIRASVRLFYLSNDRLQEEEIVLFFSHQERT